MLTRLWGHDDRTVRVSSPSGSVRVYVDSEANGLPSAPLSKDDTHEALLKAKEKAEDFIAAVEGDIEATAP